MGRFLFPKIVRWVNEEEMMEVLLGEIRKGERIEL
jgi:hypothetical protein